MATKIELLEKAKTLGLNVKEDIKFNDLAKIVAKAEKSQVNDGDKNESDTPEPKTKGGLQIFYVPEYGANVKARNLKEAVEKAKKVAGVQE